MVPCKTTGCNAYLVVRHLGKYDPNISYVSPNMTPFRLACNTCAATNEFDQHDLLIRLGPQPAEDFLHSLSHGPRVEHYQVETRFPDFIAGIIAVAPSFRAHLGVDAK